MTLPKGRGPLFGSFDFSPFWGPCGLVVGWRLAVGGWWWLAVGGGWAKTADNGWKRIKTGPKWPPKVHLTLPKGRGPLLKFSISDRFRAHLAWLSGGGCWQLAVGSCPVATGGAPSARDQGAARVLGCFGTLCVFGTRFRDTDTGPKLLMRYGRTWGKHIPQCQVRLCCRTRDA